MTTADEIESDLQAVRRVLFEYPKQLKHAKESLENINQELSDIQHVFEFGKINGPETMNLSKDYKRLRRERRRVKNEIELLQVVDGLADGLPEGRFTHPIGEIRKKKEAQGCRSYRMRVRTDLEKYMVR